MARYDFIYKFVILGDDVMINTIKRFNTHSVVPYDMINRQIDLYYRKILGAYVLSNQNLRNFLRAESMNRYITLFFQGSQAMIFVTRSFDHTRQLLREENRAAFFKYMSNDIPIYIISGEEENISPDDEYQKLLANYFINMGENIPKVFHLNPTKGVVEIIDQITTHFFLHYARKYCDHDERLVIYTLCAICREQKEKLQVNNNYLICTDCNPKDYDEDKVRVWLKLDRGR